eukprot:CFRG2274T1
MEDPVDTDLMEMLSDEFFVRTVFCVICGLCMRIFGESASSFADWLIMLLFTGLWADSMVWMAKESIKDFPPLWLQRGLQRFPDTVGCACLLVTSWLLVSKSRIYAVSIAGVTVILFSLVLWIDAFSSHATFVTEVTNITYFTKYWWQICTYGSLCALSMDLTIRGFILSCGILNIMMCIHTFTGSTHDISHTTRMWLGIAGLIMFTIGAYQYRAYPDVKRGSKNGGEKRRFGHI